MKNCFRILPLVFVFCLLLGLSGCRRNRESASGQDDLKIYYRNTGKKELYPVVGVLDENMDLDTFIYSAWQHMQKGADEAEYTSAIPTGITLKNYSLDGKNLIMNFDSAYYDISAVDEILMRAAIVKTYTQLKQITTVEIRVEDQPLLLKGDGSTVGLMNGTDFTDVVGNGINAFTRSEITLYFSDMTGEKLVKKTVDVTYSNSYSVEQYVMNLLIQGPGEGEDCIRTVPADTSLLSLYTQSGTCYVNLSSDFLKESAGVRPEITVYSIVNSLTEFRDISNVQISVNGSQKHLYLDRIDLSASLKRNLDYLSNETND